ncbi:unnamed protein product [Amoebophrya sp. A25]|nr:unnamed protein product [Amoebophrya sp. A25]|eukprot:GSA25T00022590001.1
MEDHTGDTGLLKQGRKIRPLQPVREAAGTSEDLSARGSAGEREGEEKTSDAEQSHEAAAAENANNGGFFATEDDKFWSSSEGSTTGFFDRAAQDGMMPMLTPGKRHSAKREL